MGHLPTSGSPDPPRAHRGRVLRRLGWLLAYRRSPEERSALAFGFRLAGTVILTFGLIAAIGYVVVGRDLASRQIADYAGVQRADGRAFEKDAARGVSKAVLLSDINRLLESVVQRPGTLEAFLLDQHQVIRAAANDGFVGTVDVAPPRVDAVLKGGGEYAGRAVDPSRDRRDFEFVIPVNLPGGRYAYEAIYDHNTYDAKLGALRGLLALVGLLALACGGIVFYLVGGRRLMRDHRMVLLRATRDGLTDLPNQRAFQDELPQAVGSAARYQDSLALVLLDIDDFKLINDRLGHPHGDTTLKGVAAILRDTRLGDRPYRIGGDEFALLLAHTDTGGARTLTVRLSGRLAAAGMAVSIGCSVLRPGVSAETMLSEADAALYEAKRQGGGRTVQFDDVREHVLVTTSEEKEAVRRLLDEGRLTTVFQPIWDFKLGTLIGLEALARPDPSYGLSGPAEAVRIAEQIGRVQQLDVLFAETALRLAPELEPGSLLFLNLSPLTLDLDADAPAWLGTAVERAGLRPQEIVIEVTERFGGRTASVVKRLKRLREQGFKVALDDIGTGNAGLEMLRNVEVEFVKLDGSIVAAAATEPSARAVLVAMAAFARQTGAFVIAEGVEDEGTLEFLRGINKLDLSSESIVQGGQGFALGRPAAELSSRLPALLGHAEKRPRPVPAV